MESQGLIRALTMLGGVLAGTLAGSSAFAATLFIDAAAPAGGDGSSRRPFRSLSAALDVVRAHPSAETTVLKMAPGDYVVTGQPGGTALNIDTPRIRIEGKTRFTRDDEDVPIAISGRPTRILADPALSPDDGLDTLVRVAAEDVSVEGVVFDGNGRSFRCLYVDGNGRPGHAIARFSLEGSAVQRGVFLLEMRGASGRVEGNLIGGAPEDAGHFGSTIAGTAGSRGGSVEFRGNRVSGCDFFGAVFEGDIAALEPPSPNLAGSLHVEVADNVLTNNFVSGLTLSLRENGFLFSTVDQPARLVADVHDNDIRDNTFYNIAVHGPQGAFEDGSTAFCPAGVPAVVTARFEDNRLDRGRVNAIFTFSAMVRYLGYDPDSCYLRDSAISVEYPVAARFDCDVPDGLGDRLKVNGAVPRCAITVPPPP